MTITILFDYFKGLIYLFYLFTQFITLYINIQIIQIMN